MSTRRRSELAGFDAAASPPRGSVRLAPTARLVELPVGTFHWASALRARLDAGARPPLRPPPADLPEPAASPGRETLLVVADPPARPLGLRELRVEPLAPLVARFLARATGAGLDPEAIAAFAEEHGIEAADLASVVSDFAAEGVIEPA